MTKQHTTGTREQEFEEEAEFIIRNVHEMGMSDQLIGIKPHYYLEQLSKRKKALLQAHREAVQAAEDEAYDNIERLMSSRREADGQTISFVKLQRAIKKLKARSHNGGE